jgi:hypothetical protein
MTYFTIKIMLIILFTTLTFISSISSNLTLQGLLVLFDPQYLQKSAHRKNKLPRRKQRGISPEEI